MTLALNHVVSTLAHRLAPAALGATVLALAPAASAVAVDPNSGTYSTPDTSGAPSGTTSSSSTSSTSWSSYFPTFYISPITSHDVCSSGTLDEATFESTAQAALDAKLGDLSKNGFKVTSAAVSFGCEQVDNDDLANCEDEAAASYRTCIGWGDGTKPGPGTDWTYCYTTYQDVLAQCRAAYPAEVWVSELVIDASFTYKQLLGTYAGTFQVTTGVEYRRSGTTRQSCFYDASLSAFSYAGDSVVIGPAIESALSTAVTGTVCY